MTEPRAATAPELSSGSPDPSPLSSAPPLRLLEPSSRWGLPSLAEIWAYRELLGFLVWRDVKVRYKQTVIGAAWAVLQPLATMVLFTLFFDRTLGLPTGTLPGPVFYYSGLLPWTYLSTAFTTGGNSLVSNQQLVTKVYFPRLVVPLAAVTAPLVDLALAFLVLLVLMALYSVPLGAGLLWLPVAAGLLYATALALSIWLSALNVRYRDVRHTLPFLVQFLMFASPVIYPATAIGERWRLILAVNPAAGAIETFRWSVTGQGVPPGSFLLVSLLVLILLLASGLLFFQRTEATFADVI